MPVSIKNQQSYRYSIEDIADYAIFMLDQDGKILSWGKGSEKQFGYKSKEIVGMNFSSFFTGGGAKLKTVLDSAKQKNKYLYQRRYVRKTGSTFWGTSVATLIKDKLGNDQGFSIIIRDVTEQRKSQNYRIHQSHHDYLTGLPNRRYLEEDLKNSIRSAKRGEQIAVLFMDFNNFKRVNDKGHVFGDLVLTAIAQRLRQNTRSQDVVSRIGGDEFIILLKSFNSLGDVRAISGKILNLFKKKIRVRKKDFKISVSIGISLYPGDGKNVGDLLHFSDMALYQAKKNGGNRMEFYENKAITPLHKKSLKLV